MEHEKNSKKLKKLVSFNSMRQSMITTVRNYFSGYEDPSIVGSDNKRLKNNRTRASAASGLRGPNGFTGDKIIYQSLEEAIRSQGGGRKRVLKSDLGVAKSLDG